MNLTIYYSLACPRHVQLADIYTVLPLLQLYTIVYQPVMPAVLPYTLPLPDSVNLYSTFACSIVSVFLVLPDIPERPCCRYAFCLNLGVLLPANYLYFIIICSHVLYCTIHACVIQNYTFLVYAVP